LCAGGQLQRVVGEQFGISQSHVSQIVRRVIWDHIK
jgi:DNA-directed RNA polymerase specialized sigma subunit